MPRRLTRRQVLKSGGAAVAVATLGTTAASADSHLEPKPEHVTIEWVGDRLERFKPRLVTRHLDIEPTALYAWQARSPERETDALVYWAEFVAQDGVLPSSTWLPSDGHYGDHEPVIVEVDSETDDVVRVHASVYHWMRGTFLPGVGLTLYDGEQPQLRPVNPWHQYRTTTDPGRDVELRRLHDVIEAWLDNGMESQLVEGANTTPWMMRERGHWWADGTLGISTDALAVETAATLSQAPGIDIGGYGASDYSP